MNTERQHNVRIDMRKVDADEGAEGEDSGDDMEDDQDQVMDRSEVKKISDMMQVRVCFPFRSCNH